MQTQAEATIHAGPVLSVRVLGPLTVEIDGVRATVASRESRLLAMLSLSAGQVVGVDRLTDAVWEEGLIPLRPVEALQVCASRLRRLLRAPLGNNGLMYRSVGYQLNLGDAYFDLRLLYRCREKADRSLAEGRLDDAVDALSAGLALWRGHALEGLRSTAALGAAAVELDELRAALFSQYIDLQFRLGRHEAVLGELRRAVRDEPLREGLWAQLMLGLYRSGRQAEALSAFKAVREVLDSELGVGPSAELRTLELAILRQDHVLGWQPPAPAVAAPTASRRRPVPGLGNPLIGRSEEISQLSAQWSKAVTVAAMQVAVVTGPPGIGKSALIGDLIDEIAGQGGTVVSASCGPELVVPFQPLAAAVHQLVGDWPTERVRAAVGDLLGDLARLVPLDGIAPPATSPGAETDPVDVQRYRLLEAIRALFHAAGRTAPLALVLDDLQWADAATIAALRHVLTESDGSRLLVVLSTRELTPDLLRVLDNGPQPLQLALAGLPAAGVAALAELLAPALTPLEAATVEAILRLTDGVPFHVIEVIRQLAATPGRTEKMDAEALELPSSLQELARQRLAVVPMDSAELLGVASVIGDAVDVAVLAGVTGQSEDGVIAHLDRAARATLMREDRQVRDRFWFGHALIRQHLYESMSLSRRERLHSAVAEIVARSPNPSVAEVARHRWAARAVTDASTVGRALLAAAVHAAGSIAVEDAAHAAGRALELDRERPFGDPALVAELLLVRGPALAALGDGASARVALTDAAAQAQQAGNPALIVRVVQAQQAAGHRVGPDPASIAALTAALAKVAPDDTGLRAAGLRALAFELVQAGRNDDASEAMDEADRLSAPTDTAGSLLLRHLTLLTSPVSLPHRLSIADRALTAARSAGDPGAEARSAVARLTDLLAMGELDRFEADLTRYQQLPAVPRMPLYRWLDSALSAALAQARGRYGEAAHDARIAFAWGQSNGLEEAPTAYVTQLLVNQWLQGEVAQMAASAGSLPAGDDLPVLWTTTRALVAALAGARPTAREQFDRARGDGFSTITRDWSWLPLLAMAAQVAHLLGDRPAAEELTHLLAPYQDHFIVAGSGIATLGPVDRYLGLLAATLGRSTAADHLHRAADRSAAGGVHGWSQMIDKDLAALANRTEAHRSSA